MLRIIDTEVLRKEQLIGILEVACQVLELSPSQLEMAEQRYMTIAKWLAEADDEILRTCTIYPQGSISLQTMVKPIGHNEHDVDLVCLVPTLRPSYPPSMLKRLIGARLASNGRYKDILEEKPRCWRINYANDFHLDITPAIPNPGCLAGGELVPDRQLLAWKATNPRGYRRWFEERAALQPIIPRYEVRMAQARAEVEALPGSTRFKGVLRRCVQLFKRHRDIFFSTRAPELAPISIILTTLAARSYALCVTRNRYETELDVLVDVLRNMPAFVERGHVQGREQYFVWNETTEGENFAEKWNADPGLAEAFYLWHRQGLQDFQNPLAISGLDEVRNQLSGWLGKDVTGRALAVITEGVSTERSTGQLAVTPRVGLTTVGGTTVKRNTFFGREEPPCAG
ncbi:MAG TPA: nucleotidyltransferase [Thermoanaerobaculia bacterium]|nr:nucleotidyltransferase [Thermoanaerobaculia bacterium]